MMSSARSLPGLLLPAAFAAALALPAPAEQITVTHWGVLMYGVPYAVAMEKGFFKEAGVDIDGILTSKGGGTTVRNVLAGGLPYGEVALSAAVAAQRQGIEVRIVNGGVGTAADILWVVKPDSPIHSVKELAGQKVAYTSPKSVTDMLLTMTMNKAGLRPDQVQRVATGGVGPGLTALDQGGVVAAPTMDPIWSRDKGKYRPLFFIKDELPRLMQTVGITTAEFAKSSPDKLRAIIRARARGVAFTYAHPDEAAAIFARAYKLPEPMAKAAVHNMVEVHYWSEGKLDRPAMDAMVQGLALVGDIEGKVDWSKLIDESFLPAELRSQPR